MSRKVVVVIFIHKEFPSEYELISFRQCFSVLHKHPIKVIAPMGLNISNYQAGQADFDVQFIDPKWLNSIESYNKLKTSRFLYNSFKEYEYLLTYELDAFVFSDQLLEWCDRKYDFIGAPWFEGFCDPVVPYQLKGVGNSGFSLRSVKAMRRMLRFVFFPSPARYKTPKTWIKASLKYLYVFFRSGLSAENYSVQEYIKDPEDLLILSYTRIFPGRLKIPEPKTAIQFSFEVLPAQLYQMNDFKLPFGCHAWWRYDLEFWKPFIERYNYSLAIAQ